MRSKTMTNGNVRHKCVKMLSLILMNMDVFLFGFWWDGSIIRSMCVDLKEWYVCWFACIDSKDREEKNFKIRLNKAIIGHRISWCYSNMHKLKVITNSRTVALNAVTLLDIERKKEKTNWYLWSPSIKRTIAINGSNHVRAKECRRNTDQVT